MEPKKETRPNGFTKFFSFWKGTVTKPGKTFELIKKEHSVWFGFSSVFFYGILYVITAVYMYVNSLRPVMAPFLSISAEIYYYWQMFFTLPVCLCGWILLGGTAYLFGSELFRGQGRLKDYLNLLGFSFYVPSIIVIWLTEMIVALARPGITGSPAESGYFWSWFGNIYFWIGLAWALILSIKAVKTIGNISWLKSAVSAVISLAVAMGFYMIFIR